MGGILKRSLGMAFHWSHVSLREACHPGCHRVAGPRDPARRKTLARGNSNDGDDAHAHCRTARQQERIERMEKVSDEEHQAGLRAEQKETGILCL